VPGRGLVLLELDPERRVELRDRAGEKNTATRLVGLQNEQALALRKRFHLGNVVRVSAEGGCDFFFAQILAVLGQCRLQQFEGSRGFGLETFTQVDRDVDAMPRIGITYDLGIRRDPALGFRHRDHVFTHLRHRLSLLDLGKSFSNLPAQFWCMTLTAPFAVGGLGSAIQDRPASTVDIKVSGQVPKEVNCFSSAPAST
jgi:hypothetical protein